MAEAGEDEVEPLPWTAYAAVGLGWYVALEGLSLLGVDGSGPRLWVSAAVMVAMGGLCWYNGRACGALHCRIGGPGSVVVAIVAALSASGVLGLGVDVLVWAFVAVAAGAYALEAAYEASSAGSTA